MHQSEHPSIIKLVELICRYHRLDQATAKLSQANYFTAAQITSRQRYLNSQKNTLMKQVYNIIDQLIAADFALPDPIRREIISLYFEMEEERLQAQIQHTHPCANTLFAICETLTGNYQLIDIMSNREHTAQIALLQQPDAAAQEPEYYSKLDQIKILSQEKIKAKIYSILSANAHLALENGNKLFLQGACNANTRLFDLADDFSTNLTSQLLTPFPQYSSTNCLHPQALLMMAGTWPTYVTWSDGYVNSLGYIESKFKTALQALQASASTAAEEKVLLSNADMMLASTYLFLYSPQPAPNHDHAADRTAFLATADNGATGHLEVVNRLLQLPGAMTNADALDSESLRRVAARGHDAFYEFMTIDTLGAPEQPVSIEERYDSYMELMCQTLGYSYAPYVLLEGMCDEKCTLTAAEKSFVGSKLLDWADANQASVDANLEYALAEHKIRQLILDEEMSLPEKIALLSRNLALINSNRGFLEHLELKTTTEVITSIAEKMQLLLRYKREQMAADGEKLSTVRTVAHDFVYNKDRVDLLLSHQDLLELEVRSTYAADKVAKSHPDPSNSALIGPEAPSESKNSSRPGMF